MMPLHNRSDSGSAFVQQRRTPTAPPAGRVSPPVFVSRSTERSPQMRGGADDTGGFASDAAASSPTTNTFVERWRYSLGASSQGLLAFCVLNGVLGLLFAQMFRNQHISFQLAALHHGWGVEQKADACSNAAMGYFIVAALTVANPWITRLLGSPSSWFCKAKHTARSSCRRLVPKEKLSLLGYSRKGSDDSDEDEEEMRGRSAGRVI